ncbi:bifunctional DNA-binding transcriptional regulator/O6-methylguanine-DNA methyltransferase Ada [Candidatus Amarolinea aalborgensis]|jgi:AraC family transcriptional regulator of adaptative response/methylated-DNA-[protein]-cysteine methyltransferase|uniref:bifunctional DNA-binding transcriptional regulator/O6-methylguanine-DNA methyltransferase Ada n=1 Tax=Candidatus Amarolinea aalborgensis TaxID=2249329 RepID=UPI003BF98306
MMDQDRYWQAVLARDAQFDGQFIYAVHSTGVYCRPSCPSRRPRRDGVIFFAAPAAAEAAGYRPCRRCQPDRPIPAEPNLSLIQDVCAYLAEPHERMPSLQELADRFSLSPAHLQRTFKRIVGVSPRQYAAEQRLARFKGELKEGLSVTEAVYNAGFQSSSTAYTDATDQLGMTPGQYRRGGDAARVGYTVAPCGLGQLLLAATERGICAVRLGDSEEELARTLAAEFPAADLQRAGTELNGWLADLLAYVDGQQAHLDLPLDVRATAFQRRVWEALRAIPYGSTRSYSDVAAAIGQPTAVRAVARACAANPAALVIPCHRVIRSDGDLGGYRWGLARKRALLAQEAQHAASQDARAARLEE